MARARAILPRLAPAHLARLSCALATLLACTPALCSGFSVMPTRLQFNADRGVQSVLITNTGPATVTLETEVRVWPESEAGQHPSDVVVSPAVVTLPPGQRARVRVGLLRSGDGRRERAYRLYFTQLPSLLPQQEAGLSVLLRLGLPLWVAPLQPRPAALLWSLAQDGEGWHLRVHNPGNVHGRVVEPILSHAEGREPLAMSSPYVLGGATVRIGLSPALAERAGRDPMAKLRVRWLEADDAREADVAVRP